MLRCFWHYFKRHAFSLERFLTVEKLQKHFLIGSINFKGITKMRLNWKRAVATSLLNGSDLCIKYAREKNNLSIEHIADQMGENHHTLYKWLAEARMPIKKLIAFESACGTCFITQYLAHANNKMLVDIPTGRKAEHRSINELGIFANQVMGMLLAFADGEQNQDEVLEAVTVLMADFAHQRGQIEKNKQPELLGE